MKPKKVIDNNLKISSLTFFVFLIYETIKFVTVNFIFRFSKFLKIRKNFNLLIVNSF